MITLANGHQFRFAVASGALGDDGRGHWWEMPLRWFGIIDPHVFTIITKTITMFPRTGNLRQWCPWRCVRLLPNGVVNAVGLTNPGLQAWLQTSYRHILKHKFNVIVSIAPSNVIEARHMSIALAHCSCIQGIEVNASCPNTQTLDTERIYELASIVAESGCPTLLKLAWQQPYVDLCRLLDGKIAAFDLINTVPWPLLYPERPSPLRPLIGGVSGQAIIQHARQALVTVKAMHLRTPILSGGGIVSAAEVKTRFQLGADAVAFGTMFLVKPWLPNQICKQND